MLQFCAVFGRTLLALVVYSCCWVAGVSPDVLLGLTDVPGEMP